MKLDKVYTINSKKAFPDFTRAACSFHLLFEMVFVLLPSRYIIMCLFVWLLVSLVCDALCNRRYINNVLLSLLTAETERSLYSTQITTGKMSSDFKRKRCGVL